MSSAKTSFLIESEIDRRNVTRSFPKSVSVGVLRVDGAGVGGAARCTHDAAPGRGLPIVCNFARQDEGRKVDGKSARKRLREWLVKSAKLSQLVERFGCIDEMKIRLRESGAE